jgi:hypothetical protein
VEPCSLLCYRNFLCYSLLLSHFRRKKKNDKKKLLEQVSKVAEVKKEEKSQVNEVKRTKAELAFQKMQEKMVRFLRELLLLHSYLCNSIYQVCQNEVLVCTVADKIIYRFEEINAVNSRAD